MTGGLLSMTKSYKLKAEDMSQIQDMVAEALEMERGKRKSKWTESQRWRADIIFEYYPELKKAYDLAMELTDIYNAKSHINAARLKLARWFDKVDRLGTDAFYIVIDTFHNHYETILNFFVNRATNAAAESFNAKVKAFRAQFREVSDIPFFLFRLMKLCA